MAKASSNSFNLSLTLNEIRNSVPNSKHSTNQMTVLLANTDNPVFLSVTDDYNKNPNFLTTNGTYSFLMRMKNEAYDELMGKLRSEDFVTRFMGIVKSKQYKKSSMPYATNDLAVTRISEKATEIFSMFTSKDKYLGIFIFRLVDYVSARLGFYTHKSSLRAPFVRAQKFDKGLIMGLNRLVAEAYKRKFTEVAQINPPILNQPENDTFVDLDLAKVLGSFFIDLAKKLNRIFEEMYEFDLIFAVVKAFWLDESKLSKAMTISESIKKVFYNYNIFSHALTTNYDVKFADRKQKNVESEYFGVKIAIGDGTPLYVGDTIPKQIIDNLEYLAKILAEPPRGYSLIYITDIPSYFKRNVITDNKNNQIKKRSVTFSKVTPNFYLHSVTLESLFKNNNFEISAREVVNRMVATSNHTMLALPIFDHFPFNKIKEETDQAIDESTDTTSLVYSGTKYNGPSELKILLAIGLASYVSYVGSLQGGKTEEGLKLIDAHNIAQSIDKDDALLTYFRDTSLNGSVFFIYEYSMDTNFSSFPFMHDPAFTILSARGVAMTTDIDYLISTAPTLNFSNQRVLEEDFDPLKEIIEGGLSLMIGDITVKYIATKGANYSIKHYNQVGDKLTIVEKKDLEIANLLSDYIRPSYNVDTYISSAARNAVKDAVDLLHSIYTSYNRDQRIALIPLSYMTNFYQSMMSNVHLTSMLLNLASGQYPFDGNMFKAATYVDNDTTFSMAVFNFESLLVAVMKYYFDVDGDKLSVLLADIPVITKRGLAKSIFTNLQVVYHNVESN